MSIASEITRIQQAKADIKSAIISKGGTVSDSDKLGSYGDKIRGLSITENTTDCRYHDSTKKILSQLTEMKSSSTITSDAYQSLRNTIIDLESFRKLGTGLFIHWGVYSVPAGHYEGLDVDGTSVNKNITYNAEWLLRDARVPVATYKAFGSQFTGTNWNPTQIVTLAKNAGMKYIVLTLKHHEGFSLYPTEYGGWDVTETPCRNTIVDELVEACKKEGILFGAYFSQYADWTTEGGFGLNNGKYYPSTEDIWTEEQHKTYCNNAVNQIEEFIDKYHPFVLWYDPVGAWPEKYTNILVEGAKRYPQVITNDRLLYNRSIGDFGTGERTIYYKYNLPVAESCFTMNSTWGYSVPNETDRYYYSSETIFKQFYLYTLCYGQNCLMNVGPKSDGSIPDRQISLLEKFANFKTKYGSFYDYTRINYKSMPKWGHMIQLPNNKIMCYVMLKNNSIPTEFILDGVSTTSLSSVEVLTPNGTATSQVIDNYRIKITNLGLDEDSKVGVIRLNYSTIPTLLDCNTIDTDEDIPTRIFAMSNGLTYDFTNYSYSFKPSSNTTTKESEFIYVGETGDKIFSISSSDVEATVTYKITDLTDTSISVATISFTTTDTKSTDKYNFINGHKYKITLNVSGSSTTTVNIYSFKVEDEALPMETVTGVTVNATSAYLQVGKTKTLTATVSPSDLSDTSVIWTSSDETKATVSSEGVVTGVSEGSCTIKASSNLDRTKYATCSFSVLNEFIEIQSVTFDKRTLNGVIGGSETITPTLTPNGSTIKTLNWTSSNTSVATVNSEGVVSYVGEGNCTIKATTTDGGNKSNSCSVTVSASTINVTSITLNKTETIIVAGSNETLTATVSPSNATDKTLTWSTNNANVTLHPNDTVCQVDGTTVGESVVSVSSVNNVIATCNVMITEVVPTSITLDKTTISIYDGAYENITATVLPTSASNKTVTWTSSDSTGVTVTNGQIHGLVAGTYTITAETFNGLTATCTVEVLQAVEAEPDAFNYIQSNGRQFINTKVLPNENLRIVIDLTVPKYTSKNNKFLVSSEQGEGSSFNNNRFSILSGCTSAGVYGIRYDIGNKISNLLGGNNTETADVNDYAVNWEGRNTLELSRYGFYANGVKLGEPASGWNTLVSGTTELFDRAQPIYVFASCLSKYQTTQYSPTGVKCYGIKFYQTYDENRENDVLTHNLIPSWTRDSEGKIKYGMYDTITENFCFNEGIASYGDFSVGYDE